MKLVPWNSLDNLKLPFRHSRIRSPDLPSAFFATHSISSPSYNKEHNFLSTPSNLDSYKHNMSGFCILTTQAATLPIPSLPSIPPSSLPTPHLHILQILDNFSLWSIIMGHFHNPALPKVNLVPHSSQPMGLAQYPLPSLLTFSLYSPPFDHLIAVAGTMHLHLTEAVITKSSAFINGLLQSYVPLVSSKVCRPESPQFSTFAPWSTNKFWISKSPSSGSLKPPIPDPIEKLSKDKESEELDECSLPSSFSLGRNTYFGKGSSNKLTLKNNLLIRIFITRLTASHDYVLNKILATSNLFIYNVLELNPWIQIFPSYPQSSERTGLTKHGEKHLDI